eukprot:51997-Pyramimonas_sp.AAC.1
MGARAQIAHTHSSTHTVDAHTQTAHTQRQHIHTAARNTHEHIHRSCHGHIQHRTHMNNIGPGLIHGRGSTSNHDGIPDVSTSNSSNAFLAAAIQTHSRFWILASGSAVQKALEMARRDEVVPPEAVRPIPRRRWRRLILQLKLAKNENKFLRRRVKSFRTFTENLRHISDAMLTEDENRAGSGHIAAETIKQNHMDDDAD